MKKLNKSQKFTLSMQNVGNFNRKRTKKNSNNSKVIKKNNLSINNCILYILTTNCRNLKDLLNYDNSQQFKNIISFRNLAHESSLTFDNQLPFNADLRFYKSLKNMRIYSSKKVYLSSFNSKNFNSLIFDSIYSFDFENSENINSFRLALINLSFNINELIKMINLITPRVISFKNVKIIDSKPSDEKDFFNFLMKSSILSIEVVQSFINFDFFQRLVLKKKLQRFQYKDNSNFVGFSQLGTAINYCILKNKFDGLTKEHFEVVEHLSLIGNESIFAFEYKMPFLQLIQLKKITISNQIIKKMPSFKSAAIISCSFEGLSFYELINKFAKFLKYLFIDDTVLPLDGIQILESRLSACQVSIRGIKEFYVETK